jgi:hypothetical protein
MKKWIGLSALSLVTLLFLFSCVMIPDTPPLATATATPTATASAAATTTPSAAATTTPSAEATATSATPAVSPASTTSEANASPDPDRAVTWDPTVWADFLKEVPKFVQKMAKKAMEDMARERGTYYVDRALYNEAKAKYGM